jgi:hypothetical protein
MGSDPRLAHPIVEWQKRRVERASGLVQDAATAVSESRQEPQPVPPRVLIPILERRSLEDDAYLRDRWVALLANAATSPTGLIPSFATILAELSPQEARVLNRLYQLLLEDVIQERGAVVSSWCPLLAPR